MFCNYRILGISRIAIPRILRASTMCIIKNKRLGNGFRNGLILQLSVLMLFSLLLSGCGKKAPPVPPRQVKPPPVVHDFSASIHVDMLKLARNIPTGKKRWSLPHSLLLSVNQKSCF
jgi:predicted small lipoprotein YifL